MSGFDTLARYLVRVNHWCALVQSEAASLLNRRHLALSGGDGIPRSLGTIGLVECRLCWPGPDYQCQELVSSFQRELEVVGARDQHKLNHVAVEIDVTQLSLPLRTTLLPVQRCQPHKLKNMNVNHFYLDDMVRTLCKECPRLSPTGLHCKYSRSPGLLDIRFGRSQSIGCIQRLGKCPDPIAVMAAL